jgi:hypothetical protein
LYKILFEAHEVQVVLLPKQVAQSYEQNSHFPRDEKVEIGQVFTQSKLNKFPQQLSQVVHLLGWLVQVLQGLLHGTHFDVVLSATEPSGQSL